MSIPADLNIDFKGKHAEETSQSLDESCMRIKEWSEADWWAFRTLHET